MRLIVAKSARLSTRQNCRYAGAPGAPIGHPMAISRGAQPTSVNTPDRIHIALLDLCDVGHLSRLLVSLDPPSRVSRFGHHPSDDCITAYSARALSTGLFVAGAFAKDNLIGVVELFETSNDGVSELAFAVHNEWRRRGVGTALFQITAQWAERSGLKTLRMVISRNNWPMRQLAKELGATFDLCLDEICADVSLLPPPGGKS